METWRRLLALLKDYNGPRCESKITIARMGYCCNEDMKIACHVCNKVIDVRYVKK